MEGVSYIKFGGEKFVLMSLYKEAEGIIERQKNENKEIASIALWAIRRLGNSHRQKTALNDLLSQVGEHHEYTPFILEELDKLEKGNRL